MFLKYFSIFSKINVLYLTNLNLLSLVYNRILKLQEKLSPYKILMLSKSLANFALKTKMLNILIE